jgi:hypothetical protein
VLVVKVGNRALRRADLEMEVLINGIERWFGDEFGVHKQALNIAQNKGFGDIDKISK